MQHAEALSGTPLPISATSLDPYGQLIKMLMPRAQSIAIYDRLGLPVWLNDGQDSTELQELVGDALTHDLAAEDRHEGFCEPTDRDHAAYVFLLRDGEGTLLGAVGLVSRESPARGDARPFALVQGLLRPALVCLQRELGSQYSIGDLQRSLRLRDRDLELLLGAAQDEAIGGDSQDDFAQLVQGCVDHLGCAVGALLIPEKSIAVCRTGQGTSPRVGAEVLTRTHRHLLAWTQLHRQTMTANKPSAGGQLGPVPYKIISCPVMHGAQRVLGLMVLFKPPSAPDFDLRQVRIVELLARRVAYVLLNAYDPASGLLTRPAFEKRAQALLVPEAMQGNHCVVYVDLDRMHVLNENLGMHVGDEVIVRVAEVIRRNLAPRMLASRISGDRFALFVPDATLETAQQVAESLRQGIGRLDFVARKGAVEVTASFGVARVVDGRHPLSHALAAAEIACKAAKDRGRDRVEAYEDADQSIVRRYTDVTLVGTLRQALAEGRFLLEAQPIVPLNGTACGPKYELLLRMRDERGQSIAPEKFLSAAERYQLAPAIDRWVLDHVLRVLRRHAGLLSARRACFAVNISGQSLGDQEFSSFLEEALRDAGLPSQLLSFELTETAAVANIVRAEALMRRWRELGFDVALDDFGRGLSSLSYLKTLPVTHLKIDGSFVRDVVDDDRSQAMMSAIVQLARAMGLHTVAECVESEQIHALVRELGVEFGQGFSIGRPEPLEGVIAGLVGANIGSGGQLPDPA
ncbi:MAG TPA: bifunctional diguanylate cyclase/phosphodiesterase [Steroidobacteraceae bacterium]|nr:bifunctional diguanylate cyclase/phosphodiesterase [Steroidobacteraceae bacterium]